jgi:hypothetical protein
MTVTTHPDYAIALPELKKVRLCVLGSPFIKAERYEYLPHPSQIEPNSTIQQQRYREYIAGADFPEDTSSTLISLLGKFRFGDAEPELPEKIDYLVNDCDGDGTQLVSAIENSASEVLQVKINLLVSVFKGLENEQVGNVSQSQAKEMDLRASIKRYTRESIVDWDFKRIDGKMQLAYLKLLELVYIVDPESGARTEVKSYLVLGIDGIGYYHQRFAEGADAAITSTERHYINVNGSALRWMPIQFVSDQALEAGKLPCGYGFLHKVSEAALSEYMVSAAYKETQRALSPTMFNKGWSHGDLELFKELNGGRDYVVTGGNANNNMPNNVVTEIVSASTEMSDFHWFFERSQKKMQRLGGKPDSAVQMTATEAEINAAEQNALLNSTLSSLDQGWSRAILYCGMFEGIYKQEDIEAHLDDVQLNLNTDFAKAKLTVEEVRALIELYDKAVISLKKLIENLAAGGWNVDDIKTLKQDLEDQPPRLDLPEIGEKPQDLTDNTKE